MARPKKPANTSLRDALTVAGLWRQRDDDKQEATLQNQTPNPKRDLSNVKITFGKINGSRPRRPSRVAPAVNKHLKVDTPDSPKDARHGKSKFKPDRKITESAGQPKVESKPPSPEAILVRVGGFKPNPLLIAAADDNVVRLRPASDGITDDLLKTGEDAEEETDLIIGLDFGTSSTKVVIRDHFADHLFAVPFTDSTEIPYLLPSRVWKTGSTYSLDGGDVAKRDLKLGLLGCGAASPVDEFNDACAFLALVIRHCRGWLLSEHTALYARKRLLWSLNLGLPARSYEGQSLVTLFRRLAWASFSLAGEESVEINTENCNRWRLLSQVAVDSQPGRSDFHLGAPVDAIGVVPEIAAQIHGFVSSAKWDWKHRPMMMLIDVGAGTVDAAFFSYTRLVANRPRVAFFGNEVQPNGVMNLHRERIGWLSMAAQAGSIDDPPLISHLQDVRFPTDRLTGLPERVRDYVPGFDVLVRTGARDVDESFYATRYRQQIGACIRAARHHRQVPLVQMKNVPCFLTGGGSRMALFAQVLSEYRARDGVTLEPMKMSIPYEGFDCPGLRTADMDRLSVAYGLSHHGGGGQSLADIVRTMDVPPLAAAIGTKVDWQSNYIGKEAV